MMVDPSRRAAARDDVVDLFEGAPIARVGAKAANLATAHAAGFAVPPGVVITADAARADLVELAAAARARWSGRDVRLAVRSSATAEDGQARSFAGQLESVLDVHPSDLAEAIARCWGGADALRLLRYGSDPGKLALIVQELVPADVAGVAFSADPRTGERDVVIVEASRGLGDALVSGRVTPERWRVTPMEASRVHEHADGAVLTSDQASEIARLAREQEALFGAPQDVEWALAQGTLWLLQARPITALPAAPRPVEVVVPPGTWERDDHHGVLSPLGWAWLQPYPKEMAAAMASCGLPIKDVVPQRIGGHLYMRMVMDGPESAKVPPRWVLWLASRLVPAMRRGNKLAEALLDGEAYMSVFDDWTTRWRPELVRDLAALDLEDPSAIDDEALLARIQAAMELSGRALRYHARLHGPGFIALGQLGVFTEEALGWPPSRALALLRGASPKTTEVHAQIAKVLAAHAPLAAPFPRSWGELHARAPSLAAELAAWLRDHRLRQLHYDPKHPSLGERPEYVLSIAEGLAMSAAPVEDDTDVEAHLAEARERLSGPTLERFEELRERARRAYGLRDENGVDTVSKPAGLLRHFVLELGRRLPLDRADHAVYLAPEEHGPALRGEIADLRERVERRRGEESWAEQHRGPRVHGPPSPPMPDVSAFPRGLSAMMKIFGWVMRCEEMPEPSAEGALVGTGLGRRVVEARARVIDRPEQLAALAFGEVLVCRITSPEWSIGLGRVAAIVTNEGGALSHPAIIAREFDIPAVVGTSLATQRIATGDLLRVDPVAGTVTVLASGSTRAR